TVTALRCLHLLRRSQRCCFQHRHCPPLPTFATPLSTLLLPALLLPLLLPSSPLALSLADSLNFSWINCCRAFRSTVMTSAPPIRSSRKRCVGGSCSLTIPLVLLSNPRRASLIISIKRISVSI